MTSTALSASPFNRVLFILYGVSALAGMAVGLYNPIIAVMMKAAGYSDTAIGGASSLFFLCVILTAPLAGFLTQRISMRMALACGLVLAGTASCLFAYAQTSAEWFGYRGLLGAGIGLYLIGGQSAVNTFANDRNRTIVGGLHALCFGIGMGVGPILGTALYEVTPALAMFVCAGILFLGAPVVLIGLPVEVASKPRALRLAQIKRISLALHAVFAYGVAEAILMSLFPVFMLDRGYSMTTMSIAFSAFVVGGIISTVPLTKWADKAGQERVLAFCACVGVLGSLAMTLSTHPYIAMAASAVTGACLGPVFALALALLGRRLPKEDLAGGSAVFTAFFSLGSMVAPWLAALIMAQLGSLHLFTLSTLLFATLLVRLVAARPAAQQASGA